MLAPKVTLTREELYEKVWSIPMQKLAVEFSFSDRGFAKLCRRYEVPVSPRGYWARIQVGQSVKRIPLPSVSQANLSTIEINFRERQDAVEGTSTEGNGVPTTVVAHDRAISHPIILLIEHGHFAEVSSESEALRLSSPRGSLTPMYTVPMDSAFTDPGLRDWLRWASESANTPMFVRTVAKAALIACSPDYLLLRPVLLELNRRVPQG